MALLWLLWNYYGYNGIIMAFLRLYYGYYGNIMITTALIWPSIM